MTGSGYCSSALQPTLIYGQGQEISLPLCVWAQDRNALQAAEAAVSRILLWMMAGRRESVMFARKVLHFSSPEPVLI